MHLKFLQTMMIFYEPLYRQERQQKIVQAEGEAKAAAMLGESLGRNPGYLKLRKLNASKHIAKTVSFNLN